MKQIVYTCTDSGITPSVPQKAGVQGDCEVTEIIFDVTAIALPDTPLFRIEVADGSGHFTAYTDLTVTDDVIDEATHKRVHFLVPLAVTDAGGMATMHLVISNETEVMYTYPAMLSFKGSTYGSDTRLDYTHDMSDMLQYASDLIGGYQGALLGKVDKVEGKQLSTNDYTNADKSLVQTIPDKANTSDVNDALANKVDKIPGKGLSTNDYTNVDKELVQAIPGKANTSDVNDALANKVDKVDGKGLSTNDYTNVDKELVQAIPGKANTSDVNDALANKVDKIPGKGLSTNDYTSIDQMMVQTISGKANVVTVNQQLAGKVDKVDGKGLSTNDFTNEDKSKLDSLENYDDTELKEDIANKQDTLTAGSNITIIDNVISASGGGSGTVDDVKVDGVSVVSSGIANIDLSGKANASDVYTKQEVNTRLQTKAPLSDVDILFDTIGNVPETTTVQAEIDSLDTRVTYLEEHGGGGDTSEIYSILRVMKTILKSAVFTSDQQSNFAVLESLLPDGVIQDGSNLIVRSGVNVSQNQNEISLA